MSDDPIDHGSLSEAEWNELRDHLPGELLTFAEAVGRNSRRIRTGAGVTLDDVARAARELGARWTTARVVELEKGARTLTVSNLILLQVVLSSLTRRGITLAELVNGRFDIEVTERFVIAADGVARSFSGSTTEDTPGIRDHSYVFVPDEFGRDEVAYLVKGEVPDATLRELAQEQVAAPDLTEVRAAKKLGVHPVTLRILARRVWGHSLPAERDRRLGPASDASPQAKGRITRDLIVELRARRRVTLDGHDQ